MTVKVYEREYPPKKGEKKGRVHLFLHININGVRTKEKLEIELTGNKQEDKRLREIAEIKRNNRYSELLHNSTGIIPPHNKKKSFLKYFEEYASQHPKWSNPKSALKAYREFQKKQITFEELSVEYFERVKKFFLENYNNNTAHTYFAIVKRVANDAFRKDLLPKNYAASVPHIKYIQSKRNFLTEEELTILKNTDCQIPEVKRAFLFACLSGLRFSDIKNLKWENISNDEITVKQKKTKEHLTIPLHDSAKSLLHLKIGNVIPIPSANVFELPNRWYYNEILKRWFKDAGIEKVASSHLARHTFATMCLTMDIDLYTVSKLLGHKDIKHTQIYAQIVDSKRVEAIKKLPNIF